MRSLVADGTEVVATARSRRATVRLQEDGATPLYTDLANIATWAAEAADAEVVWHLGLPRLTPPIRSRTTRRLAARARQDAAAIAEIVGDRALVLASSGLVYGDHEGPAPESAPLAPLALGRPALAVEEALAAHSPRVVRLPWVYGAGGLAEALVNGLRTRRWRTVGSGANRWSLISVADAVAALRLAPALAPGAWNAAEEDAPTQSDVVAHLCARVKDLRRPDHVPVRFASFSLGGALAGALAASTVLDASALRGAGWTPASDWREDLVALASR